MAEQEETKNWSHRSEFIHRAETQQANLYAVPFLEEENRQFANSPGISINNRDQGFHPAFMNIRNGSYLPSRFADGQPAPIHVLDGLPDEWIAGRARNGQATHTFPQIISGFMRNGNFYTRDEAASIILNQDDDLI